VQRSLPLRKLVATAGAVTMTLATVAGLQVAAPTPALALDNGLARTPPMGFNNWNTTNCRADFNETMIKGIADLFVSRGLRDVGYQYVNIDDCWALPQRNAQGDLVPDPARFPNGIKALADYVHAKGLKFGLYTSAGTKTCNKAGFPGGLGHEQQDANLFASFGADYLKYDNCNNQGVDAQQRYTAMRDALRNTGRPITYSITEWGRTGPPKVWEWGKDVGNLWRTTGDISDNFTSMIGKAQVNRTLPQWAGPGHWNDPDMLEIGNGGMTAAEYRTHLSLWAIMAAPLLIGTDLRKASEDTFTILKNADVIAVDQDRLGRQATVLSNSGGLVVYSKVLADGDRAVALSNETTATATISTTAAAIGLGGSASYTLKDLWSKATRSTTGAISASVPGHATVLYRVSRDGGQTRYEAESGTFQGTVDNNWDGFSGTGFVNSTNAVGSFVQFTVNAATDGPATLVFDYANGTTADRPMDVFANGTLVAQAVPFPPTGAFSLWKTSTVTANLRSGANTIRAVSTTANGGPNLDYLDVVTGVAPLNQYEAEGATISRGVVESNHAGFTGGGFVNYDNVIGSFVDFTVNVPQAGPTALRLRFANGTTVNRPMDITVNGGTAAANVAFAGTGDWANWVTVTVPVNLNAGNNTIRATATTANGGPNLDNVQVG
jgi:alpha-galactosidase